ncbi:MAG: hypothetical protein ACR2IE_19135 [Candidatus Sumerlaeaceae bacterium]
MHKCSSCGRELGVSQRTCLCGQVVREVPGEDTSSRFDYGMLLPWIPAAAFVLLVAWVPWLDYNAHPGTKLLKIVGFTVLLSALFSLLDAERLVNEPPATPQLNFSGPMWFLLQVLVWPVAFPLYLYAQYAKLSPRRMRAGWVTGGLFLVAALVAWNVRATGPRFGTARAPRAKAPSSAPVQVAAAIPSPASPALTPVSIVASATTTLPVITPIPYESETTAPAALAAAPAAAPQAPPTTPAPVKSTNNDRPDAPAFGADILPGGRRK